jgi:hypothetical protein
MKNLTLKHYSNNKLTVIEPKQFGKNYFTKNDAKLSKLPRSFFYVNNSEVEQTLKNSKYLHITTIDSSKLYNLSENKDNLTLTNIDKVLRQLKRKYLGIVYTINNLQIANIFVPIKVKKIICN